MHRKKEKAGRRILKETPYKPAKKHKIELENKQKIK